MEHVIDIPLLTTDYSYVSFLGLYLGNVSHIHQATGTCGGFCLNSWGSIPQLFN